MPFYYVMEIGKSMIVRDEYGNLYQRFETTFNQEKHGILQPSCQELCEHQLSRHHSTCFFSCRHKKALEGKIPKVIRVQPLTVFVWKDRPYAKIKDVLLKKVFTLFVEPLST